MAHLYKKVKPKISAVSPMKIGGDHIGRSHSSMQCYRKYYTFLHLRIENTFSGYVRLEIAAFLDKVERKKTLIGDVVVFESHFKAKKSYYYILCMASVKGVLNL